MKESEGENESGLETNEHPNPVLSCYNNYYYANKKSVPRLRLVEIPSANIS